MCGVPHHAVTAYVGRLVKQGFRVALCEQMEDPRTAKGVVKREVVRVVTPGTQLESSALDADEAAFVLALAPGSVRPRRGLDRRHHRRVRGRGVGGRRAPGTACATTRGHAPARAAGAARGRAARLAHRPAQPEGAIPRTELDAAAFDPRAGAPRAARPFRRADPGSLRLRRAARRRRRRRGRPALRARHPEARPRPRDGPAHARRRGRPRHRRAHPPQPGAGGERGGRIAPGHAARRPRPDAHGHGRAPAARNGCCGRWPSWSRSRTGSTRSRSSPSARSSARGCARCWADVQDLDRIVGRVSLGTAFPARPRARWPARCARCPRPRPRVEECQAPLVRSRR